MAKPCDFCVLVWKKYLLYNLKHLSDTFIGVNRPSLPFATSSVSEDLRVENLSLRDGQILYNTQINAVLLQIHRLLLE